MLKLESTLTGNVLDGRFTRRIPLAIAASGVLYTLLGALDSTLTYDDPGLVIHYGSLMRDHSVPMILRILFFIEDLVGAEYRLYGVSKILHFVIWQFAGAHAWVYSAFIAGSQFLSGLGLYGMLKALTIDRLQALILASAWILSPFAWTTTTVICCSPTS